MNRTIATLVAGIFLTSSAPLFADDAKKEVKRTKDTTEVNAESTTTKADGSKVKKESKKVDKTDGTGEAKNETKVENPQGDTVKKESKKVKRSKKLDGSVETKTETSKDTKNP